MEIRFQLMQPLTQMSLNEFHESKISVKDFLQARISFNQSEDWKDLELFKYLGNEVLIRATNRCLDSINHFIR